MVCWWVVGGEGVLFSLWWNVETVIDPVTGKPVPNKDNDRFHALVDGFKGVK